MRYEIEFAPEAARDYRELDAHDRGVVRDTIETHLRHQPTRTSKSRIKRLRGLSRPQYRLRVGDLRVFYDVTESTVQILAVVAKSLAHEWLERCGEKS
jgi:mRNA-degrading endonuclease RelE of RelBE toxin-antitoxin system